MTIQLESTIIGLVGPSGVGKGYVKDVIKSKYGDKLYEPVVATTRRPRTTDGPDRRAGIILNDFHDQVKKGEIIFDHQPFGATGDWYGFDSNSFDHPNRCILTEVHTDNVEPFVDKFGQRIVLIALVASLNYLSKNLKCRDTETEDERSLRLNESAKEVKQIDHYKKIGLIQYRVEVHNGEWETSCDNSYPENVIHRDELGTYFLHLFGNYIK